MENMKWVQSAVSKDKSRYNLCEVYRDKTELVATDGNRLHMITGMPETEPHYLSGADHSYPDWRQVMPKNGCSARVVLNSYELVSWLKRFKKAVTLMKHDSKQPTVSLSPDGFINYSSPEGVELKISILFTSPEPLEKPIGLNPIYLFDALSMVHEEAGNIEMEFNGELGPVKLTSGKRTAIVMPVRLV